MPVPTSPRAPHSPASRLVARLLATLIVVTCAGFGLLHAGPAVATAGEARGTTAPDATDATAATAASGAAKTGWRLPVAGDLERRFERPVHRYAPGHRGVDLRASPAASVVAPASGAVSFAGMVAGRSVVVMDHGPVRTTYEPVATDLDVGDRVVAGQPIGRLASYGGHCPPRACLHWGARIGTEYVDPLTLLSGPVRLLPRWSRGATAAGPTGIASEPAQRVGPMTAAASATAPAASARSGPGWGAGAAALTLVTLAGVAVVGRSP